MRHLNYGHLQYFWVVAREGSVARAAEVLHVTPQTISGQLKLLDQAVGERLFDRSGRNLVLSSTGRVVFQYADEIFSIGAELAQVVGGRKPGAPRVLNVGVVESIPKLVAAHVLQTVVETDDAPRLACHESSLDSLLGELAIHRLDLVLSDQPLPAGLHVRAFNHALGASDIAFYAGHGVASRLKNNFPQSLDGERFLLPAQGHALRRRLEDWFEEQDIAPFPAAEFDDSALLKAVAQTGAGVFAGPSAIEADICRMYEVEVVGRTSELQERYYAISHERRLKHPAVVKIIENARTELFNGEDRENIVK
ncbi:MAG: transcriptional activator NhaR [Xanthomonadales bacterium]|jgi:LysR family transcriptional activator of nhaA|nr:transcriptional activator NhaR [Xanthomonadales bacterium]